MRRLFTCLILFAFAAALLGSLPSVRAQAPVDQRIFERLAASPSGETRFMVYLGGRADLSAASALTDRAARKRASVAVLKRTADVSQGRVRASLASLQTQGLVSGFRPFFSVNAIAVRGREAAVLALARVPGVARIEAEGTWAIQGGRVGAAPRPTAGDAIDGAQSNIKQIKAHRAWRLGFTGKGVILASIDTGVRHTHEALRANYKCGVDGPHENCWYDAVTNGFIKIPYDDHDHGSHVTGTMAGRLGIGVARRAKWIACKAFNAAGFGADPDIFECSDFFLGLALDPRTAAFAPDVINNSWGDLRGLTTFQDMIDSWIAAGIHPVFAIGNDGMLGCGSSNSPGEYTSAFGIGAVNGSDVIAGFSSRGPASAPNGGTIKPDVVAPGVSVRSACSTSDTCYANFSGTSMATPHAVGTLGLMLSKDGSLSPPAARAIVEATALDISDLTCGGTAEDNNVYGNGRVDALAAVNAVP